MKVSRRLFPLFLLLLLTGISCSRKGDELIPPRLGNLVVKFVVYEESNLIPDPGDIPIILTLYRETDPTQPVRTEAVRAASGVVTGTHIEDLPADFYDLELIINLPNLPDPCCAVKVFVQLNQTTETELFVYRVRQTLMICPRQCNGD